MIIRSLLLSSLLLVASCITTTEDGSIVPGFDQEKALQASISAANQYLKVQDSENALRHLRKAAKIDESDPRVQSGMAYSFELTQDYALAEKHYQKAIKSGGENVTSFRNNYATFLAKQGRYQEAKEQLTHVVNDVLYPNRSAAFTTLGLCETRLDNSLAAEKAFSRAISLDRRNVTASLELADLQLQRGDVQSAQANYNTYRYLGRTSPKGLWVGIKLAKAIGNDSEAASQAMALKNMFPRSAQYAEYLKEYH